MNYISFALVLGGILIILVPTNPGPEGVIGYGMMIVGSTIALLWGE